MPVKTIQQLDEDNKATAVVYDHSKAKLVISKNKVRRCRRETFLSVLPYWRPSSHSQNVESKLTSSPTPRKPKPRPATQSVVSIAKPKLHVCVRTHLPHGKATLDFELDSETSISALKEMIHSRIGVQPQRQQLCIRGNFQLCDLLTLHENGIEKDEVISLSTNDATQDGPTGKPEINKEYLENLSSKLGSSWKDVAKYLGYEDCEIAQIQSTNEGTSKMSSQMLLTWWEKRTDRDQAAQKLAVALDGIGRTDLVKNPPNTCRSTDDIERPQSEKHDKPIADKQRDQKGAPVPEEQKSSKEPALDKDKPQPLCFGFVKRHLQVLVRNPFLRGPKTLCFHLDPETSVSSLKGLIHSKIGVEPRCQHLFIKRNFRSFKLIDLLTLNDCGIQQDENILLRLKTDGLLGGGRKDEAQVNDQFLRDVSLKVHHSWDKLAECLGYEKVGIQQIQAISEDDKERSKQMLLSWWRKQTNHEEGLKRLREALESVGLTELASLVPNAFQEEVSQEGSTKSNEDERLKQEQVGIPDRTQPKRQEHAGTQERVTQKGASSVEQRLEQEQGGDGDETPPQKQQMAQEIRHSSQKVITSSKAQEFGQAQSGLSMAHHSIDKQRAPSPVENDHMALKRVMASPEERVVKEARQQTTGKTLSDDVRRSQVESLRTETITEVSQDWQIMQVPSSFPEFAPSVPQIGASSALSAVHDHIYHRPVSVGAIDVSGENNTTFFGPIYQPTMNIVQNVMATGSTSGETNSAANRAKEAASQCRKELEERYTTTGSYVQLLPWVDDDMKHIKDMYTKLQFKLDKEGGIKGGVETYHDIFLITTKEGRVIKRAILCGSAGLGKSTIIDNIAHDWAVGNVEVLRQFALVFVLKMSALNQTSDLVDSVFDQLLAKDSVVNRSDLKDFIHSHKTSSGVLVLLDGFDEFQTTNLDPTTFGSVLEMLNRKVGRDWFVIVTTRPSHLSTLRSKSIVEKPFTHVDVLGFDRENVWQYVKLFFLEKFDDDDALLDRMETAGSLLCKIQSSNVLSDLAKRPMLLLLMCLLWRDEAQLPDTLSKLYRKAMTYIFRRKTPHISDNAISELIIAIGKPAVEGLISPKQRLSFHEREFEKSVLHKAVQVGILTSQRVIKWSDTHNSVQFIHKTFQECCAARYCQSLIGREDVELQRILDEIDNPQAFEYMLRFCCGDSEQCARYILNALCKNPYTTEVCQLGLNCCFESQSRLLAVEYAELFVTKQVEYTMYGNTDTLNSFLWFLEQVSKPVNQSDRLACVRTLTIRDYNLTEVCEVLASCFTGMTHLKSLTLESCDINAQNFTHLARSLVGMADVTKLDFSGNGELGGSAKTWAHYLKSLESIEKLNLSECSLQARDMKYIATAVREMVNLTRLDLSNNESLSGCAKIWVGSLKSMIYLKKLKMNRCRITRHDVRHVVEAISGMSNTKNFHFDCTEVDINISLMKSGCAIIEKLSIAQKHLQVTDIKQLGELSLVQSLKELSLIGIQSLGGFAETWAPQLLLVKLITLDRLHLEDCSLQVTDIQHLADELGQMPGLKELSLKGNRSLGGSAESWAPQLQRLKNLEKLKLTSTALKGQDMPHLTSSVAKMENVTNLDLSQNEELGGCVDTWAGSLKSMTHLKSLDMQNCLQGINDVVHVTEAISCMSNLLACHVSQDYRLIVLHVWPLESYTRVDFDARFLPDITVKDMLLSLSNRNDVVNLIINIDFILGRGDLWMLPLKQLEHLAELKIFTCSLEGTDVEILAAAVGKMATLEKLSLNAESGLGGSANIWASSLTQMEHVKCLSLVNCDLEDTDIEPLAKALSQIPKLTELSLEGNQSLGGSAETWVPHLECLKNLRKLNLTSTAINAQDMPHITSSVGEMPALTDLDISGNQDLKDHIDTWAASLTSMIHLKKLIVNYFSMGSHDGKYLVEAISSMNNLVDCDFSGGGSKLHVCSVGNCIRMSIRTWSLTGNDGRDVLHSLNKRRDLVSLVLSDVRFKNVSAAWTPSLKELTHLEELVLNDCFLDSTDIEPLASAVGQMPNLKRLSLKGNRSLGGRAKTWAPSLKQMAGVVSLNLSRCGLRFTDVAHLATGLSQIPTLEELCLKGNRYIGGSGKAWAPSLKEMAQLVRLNLGRCGLRFKDFEQLAAVVTEMQTLQELNLTENRFLSHCVNDLAPCLKQMEHVHLLKLGGCSLTETDLEHIAEVWGKEVDLEADDQSNDESDDETWS
ncbi:protein NLRC5-like [Acanthaster planci]|uniref:Protein NLRC5-like n=1 Tax=Acanthaster planci TaxID=133434 RepID=A0A8B8A6L6_ACAPL|nr:protein NLRC5-like [Acanthaster planci]